MFEEIYPFCFLIRKVWLQSGYFVDVDEGCFVNAVL